VHAKLAKADEVVVSVEVDVVVLLVLDVDQALTPGPPPSRAAAVRSSVTSLGGIACRF